jgi:hypothetical protein
MTTLCNTNGRPQLKSAVMMARNASLGENVPPSGGAEVSKIYGKTGKGMGNGKCHQIIGLKWIPTCIIHCHKSLLLNSNSNYMIPIFMLNNFPHFFRAAGNRVIWHLPWSPRTVLDHRKMTVSFASFPFCHQIQHLFFRISVGFRRLIDCSPALILFQPTTKMILSSADVDMNLQ